MDSKDHLATFFLLCTTAESGTDSPATIQLSRENWQEFTTFCITRSVAPYLYGRMLENQRTDVIPTDSARRLKQLYIANMGLNMAASDQFLEILRAMKQFNIPVIPLKGAHLVFKVYKTPALRMMSDLDILVRKEDIPATMQALASLGYAVNARAWESSPGHHLPPIKKPDAFFPVEVHWRIIPPSRMAGLPIEKIWENARQTSLAGCEYLEQNPAHLLMHICQHTAYQHYFSNGIKAACDIDVIIRSYAGDLDWQEFLRAIKTNNAAEGILLVLWITHTRLETPLPRMIEDAISAQSFPETIIADALESMAGAQEFPDSPSGGVLDTIRWWFGKAGKFMRETGPVPHTAGRSSAWNRVNRLVYVIRNNLDALSKLPKNTAPDTGAQSQKRIRDYLGLR